MSVRRTDLRLALPQPVRRAVVLGGLTAWEDGLASAGVSVGGAAAGPDLIVAPAKLARKASAAGAPAVLLEGRGGGRELRRAGYSVRRFLPLPNLEQPSVVLPLAPGPAARYALTQWRPARTLAKQLRDRLASTLIPAGAFPPARSEQILGLRSPGPPFAVAAAEAMGVPADAPWFMALGQGDPLTRIAFYLFDPDEPEPRWVLKVARVTGLRGPFDRDEDGLGLAAAGGRAAQTHAPALIGRFEVEGLEASVETAAVGEQLSGLIARDRARARSSVEAIAAWIVEVSMETASPEDELAEERARLRTMVLPTWLARGAPANLVDCVPELPAVLQHNDLGSWNIIVGPGGFTAVDWESARRYGLPLWDLLYFLIDALPLLEGAKTPEQRASAAVRILRGETESSAVLFHWLRRAASAAAVPDEAVGAVATLCWLHHGLSHVPRRAAAEQREPGSAAVLSPIDLLAPLWLQDPALGPGWNAWRR